MNLGFEAKPAAWRPESFERVLCAFEDQMRAVDAFDILPARSSVAQCLPSTRILEKPLSAACPFAPGRIGWNYQSARVQAGFLVQPEPAFFLTFQGRTMGEWLSRQALHNLVWSEPLKTLSERFGISDVALRKSCQRALVPSPERGYWARKDAGKTTYVIPLPERSPGMEDEIQVGAGREYYYRTWTEDELLGPLPPPPHFETTLDSVRRRIASTIGKVTVPRIVNTWHPALARLLSADERNREKHKTSSYIPSWERPRFEGREAQRRIRILNALFFALGRFHGMPRPDGDGEKTSIRFYRQHILIKLASAKAKKVGEKSIEGRLTLAILDDYTTDREFLSWSDDDAIRIEGHLSEIAIEIIYQAEVHYRNGVERRHEWRKKRKIELEQEIQRRKVEAERAERERIRKIEKERVDRLLSQAAAFEQATVIRRYVERVTKRVSDSSGVPANKLEAWSRWALAEADRIDPSVNCGFLEEMDRNIDRGS